MTETLSITHSHQETAQSRPCESCHHWERQFTIQYNKSTQLEKQLGDRDQQLARLAQDMQFLNTKYVSVIDRVADIQHEKDLVEHDLEELSCKLFEQANDMVATEKREKRVLEIQLQAAQQQLLDEQAQLQELRQRLLDWDTDEQQQQQRNHRSQQQQQQQYPIKAKQQPRKKPTKRKLRYYAALTRTKPDETSKIPCYDDDDDDDDDDDGANDGGSSDEEEEEKDGDDVDTWQDAIDDNLDDPQVRAQHDLALLHGLNLPRQLQQKQASGITTTISITNNNNNNNNAKNARYAATSPMIDQMQLEAFQQFVHSAGTTPLKKLPQMAYVKYCQLEDVEPCLRFGPQSRLSTKKMMNHLLYQSCFIQQHMCLGQETTTSTATAMPTLPSSVAQRPLFWDRWNQSTTITNINTNNSPFVMTCAACGRFCDHRTSSLYQFRLDEKDTWLPMDQYCRDRLVAVCEFFAFIRNIHLQLYSHRTLDDLYSENIRLRLQMFYSRMGALPMVLNGMGLNADTVGKACPPLDQDDVSDGSLSSYFPATPK